MPSKTPVRRLYLASHNAHKAAELAKLAGGRFDVRLARELDPALSWNETGQSFVENARIKAEAVRRLTQAAVLADDSGLEVAALQGAPGIYSSRYSGQEGNDATNNAKLLAAMQDIPRAERGARFVCALYFIDEDGRASSFIGQCPGSILEAPRGGGGFGYDPLFLLAGDTRTMAELTPEEKNRISHSGRAVAAWLAHLDAADTPKA